jgi:hypothetical protein
MIGNYYLFLSIMHQKQEENKKYYNLSRQFPPLKWQKCQVHDLLTLQSFMIG